MTEKHRHRAKTPSTLVEMLIVIAIIATFAGLHERGRIPGQDSQRGTNTERPCGRLQGMSQQWQAVQTPNNEAIPQPVINLAGGDERPRPRHWKMPAAEAEFQFQYAEAQKPGLPGSFGTTVRVHDRSEAATSCLQAKLRRSPGSPRRAENCRWGKLHFAFSWPFSKSLGPCSNTDSIPG